MKTKMLIWLLTLLGAVSCTSVETSGGSLRIVFETGDVQTKAAGPDGNVEDGGGIFINEGVPDVVILISNADNEIVATYPSSGRGGILTGSVEGTPAPLQASISFTGLTGSATYTVYAFANAQGLWAMKCGEDPVSNLTDLTSAARVEALQFQPTAGDKDAYGCLAVKASRLPLSAKGAVTLTSLGNGEISLRLQRCVAKVTAVFENQCGEDLLLHDFSNTFYHMCPETGYVVPHETDYPVNHGDSYDGALSAIEAELSIDADETVSQSWYVFPSLGYYTCDISFDLEDAGNTVHCNYTDLPVLDDHGRDISYLARNQHLTIITRISRGRTVSFNFEVADWNSKTETVTFN